jgi:hypothetical protein
LSLVTRHYRVAVVILALVALGALTGAIVMAFNSTPAQGVLAAIGILAGAETAWLMRRHLVPGGRGSSPVWLVAAAVIGGEIASGSRSIQLAALGLAAGFLAVSTLIVWRRRAAVG